MLREFYIHNWLSIILEKGDNFCNFLFCFSAHQAPSEMGLLWKERICSRLSKFFSSRVDPRKHTTSQQRRYNVTATSRRCSGVVTTLSGRCMLAGLPYQKETKGKFTQIPPHKSVLILLKNIPLRISIISDRGAERGNTDTECHKFGQQHYKVINVSPYNCPRGM